MNKTYFNRQSTKTPEQQALERKINLKYGNDGEEHYLEYLRTNYKKYTWEKTEIKLKNEKGQYCAVDIIGYNHDDKVIISIEIKSKRYVRGDSSHKYHAFNKSKLDYIKEKMNEGYMFRAYIVMNLLKTPQKPLSNYNKENAGQFIIHEITRDKLASNVGIKETWSYFCKKTKRLIEDEADFHDEMYEETELYNSHRNIVNYGIRIHDTFWENHDGFKFPKQVKMKVYKVRNGEKILKKSYYSWR